MGGRWYVADPLRPRHVEKRMEARGGDVDPSPLHRWPLKYSPRLEEALHGPVIRTHPVTGRKAIYVRAGECVGIVSMPEEEALPLIQELSDFVLRPAFLYRHQWQVGDLLK